MLFSGLCSWIVAPNNEDLTRNAMMLVGMKYLCHLELLGRGAFPDQPIFGDAASRISPTGRDFFRDFYHPIGGLITLLESGSQNDFSERLFSASELTMNVVGLMTTVHMHVAHVAPLGRFANASPKKSAPVARLIFGEARKQRGWDERNILKKWHLTKHVSALVYSASCILLDDGSSLLNLMRNGEAEYKEHGHLLSSWIAKARFVTIDVLGALRDSDARQLNEDYLPAIDPLPIEAPSITDAEHKYLRDGFKRSNP